LDELKKDDQKFFDAVYGSSATSLLWWDTWNTEVGDGYKYRGRWYNQLTFKNSYKKYWDIIGEDLVTNPDRLNDSLVASKVALVFFKEWNNWQDLSTLRFTNKEDAAKTFARINWGNINRPAMYEDRAVAAASKFDVKTENVA
jgi:predicted chitinase